MIDFFAYLFGYLLNFIYQIIQNYGIAIIIFTIILKIIMLPITISQQKTLRKNAKVQEQIKEIQDKYKNDLERLNKEMIDVYKREKMNPFSGCLSSIVQLILILSIFYLVRSPLTFMKQVDQTKIETYINEIKQTLPEGERLNYAEIAIIKAKGQVDEEVNLNMEFLGLDLSSVPTENMNDFRVYIIPILYVISSIISMKITTSMSQKKTSKEESLKENTTEKSLDVKQVQEDPMVQMNKNMMLLMPIMSVSIAMIAPLGLALYWLVSNIIMTIEKIVLDRILNKKEEEEK